MVGELVAEDVVGRLLVADADTGQGVEQTLAHDDLIGNDARARENFIAEGGKGHGIEAQQRVVVAAGDARRNEIYRNNFV